MKTFAILSITVAVARAGYLGGSDIGSTGGSTVIASGGPGISYGPAISSGYAPAGVSGAVVAAPVGAVAAGPRVHEIHSHNSRPVIRLEEFSRGGQIIRIHEAPQGPPQVLKVQVPGGGQDVIRVIGKSSGPAHVERVLHRATGAQIINVQKPGPAPARIVQVVRGPSVAPRVEFIQEPESQNQVYVAHAPATAGLAGGSSGGAVLAGGLGGVSYGEGPSYGGASLGGVYSAAPVATSVISAPQVAVSGSYVPSGGVISAAPALSYSPSYSSTGAIPVHTKVIKKYH